MDLPATICLPLVEEAVVQAVGLALPVFDGMRADAVAAPEVGQRDGAVGEFGFHPLPLLHQQLARADDFALGGAPGAELAAFGTREEVFEGLFARDFFGLAFDFDLPLQREPGEVHRDFAVARDFLRLAAVVVGVEDEAVAVEVFEQYRTLRRLAVSGDGGDDKAVRLGDFRGERVAKLMERGVIEIAPLAFMRGRTLNDAFIILDEAQNTTVEQMKMFLTRLGFGSTAVITGDATQIDLPKGTMSGLKHAARILDGVDGISFTRFAAQDVVRHPLVQRIVEAYAAAEQPTDHPTT